MKILIDSNVLISGLVFGRKELELLLTGRKEHSLVISERILNEVTRVLLEKFPEHIKLLSEFIECSNITVIAKEEYIEDSDKHDIIRDRHDRHVLACAHASRCDVIVSGDNDLLTLKEYHNIKIINTRKCLELINP